ncbi:hypothetical protein D925_01589 [Enterococcus faecalis B83616-1]|nr:hypothetical protein D925_01589 [Enterococcus faecalis B83616-1]
MNWLLQKIDDEKANKLNSYSLRHRKNLVIKIKIYKIEEI